MSAINTEVDLYPKVSPVDLDMSSSIDNIDINQSASDNKNWIQDVLGWLRMPKCSKWCFFVSIAFAVVGITAFIIYTDLQKKDTGPAEPPPPPQPQKAPFLKDYFLYHTISPSLFNGTFITGKDFYYYDSLRNLKVFDLETKRSDVILPFTSWILLNGTFDFWFSEDLQYMMYASYNNPIYRHSYYAIYQIYSFKTRKSTYVTTKSLQLAVMAPKTNSIAYVDKNNIYYREKPEDETNDIRITSDGIQGKIYNGVPDWVYEEEIVSSNSALWFSKEGSYLAYFKFNDSNVLIQAIPVYGPPNLRQWQYTRYDQIHYPKVGTPNPSISVHVVSLKDVNNSSEPTIYNYPAPVAMLDGREPIASLLAWANDTQFIIIWLNRYQNMLVMELCSVGDDNPCRVVFEYAETSGWLQLENPKFDRAGNRMIFTWWHKQINGDSYPHVTMLDLTQLDPEPKAITSGLMSVSEIAGWNFDTDEIFFVASTPDTPEQLRTYKVSARSPHEITCISCQHQHVVDGSNCTYAGALFSTNAHFYALSCAGPNVPEVTIFDASGNELMVWEDNVKTRNFVEAIRMPVRKVMTVEVEDGFSARVQLLLPPELADFDETKNYGKKYPMLVNVYGGPDSSMVKDMFNTDFNTYMVANKSIIGVSIDGRGSNLMGLRARYAIYKKLGVVEVDDQLSVIRYLQDKYSNVIDRNRTASWGWSYGGYATGMMLTGDHEHRIKCGVSIAPVTDWVYYDSIYTERFMQTYEENLQGYMRASLLNRSSKLKEKEFFLIHGTKDDNVHYQNSMQLAKLLARSDIPFRQMTYPDEDHALKFVQPHFYHAIEDFLDECFFEDS
ncbi:venom dipeptidyl peptidase 4-like isoform X1 [Macrosteles quadrilineatus]|uniref:venom dipeptidyl peptidase 4-like isoform X1 n=1 Tax=Macrosteles quadrilineatus TaxID=74068 RepID=UPI0023E334E6|nr:venom dipeptidyl peptidase 4-like isoform X1 [Macrosteles quadrilineatus]XP_054290874.1 venom dipeptidyl peptidase 4-like isoform X1 [Macrosteles quadrilineatus]